MRPRKVTAEIALAMQGMRRETGSSVEEVAERFGVSRGTAYTYTRGCMPAKRGYILSVAKVRDPEREQRTLDRMRAGDSMAEIAKDEGLTRERVRQIVRRYEDRTGELVPRSYERSKPAEVPFVPMPSEAQRLLRHASLVPYTGCWRWHGPVRRHKGKLYPQLPKGSTQVQARRESYRLWRGVIPPKHFAVPRCTDDMCINPFHLEAVSVANRLRESEKWDHERNTWHHTPSRAPLEVGGMCGRGHLLAEEDIRIGRNGRRTCKPCERFRAARRKREKQGAPQAGAP